MDYGIVPQLVHSDFQSATGENDIPSGVPVETLYGSIIYVFCSGQKDGFPVVGVHERTRKYVSVEMPPGSVTALDPSVLHRGMANGWDRPNIRLHAYFESTHPEPASRRPSNHAGSLSPRFHILLVRDENLIKS